MTSKDKLMPATLAEVHAFLDGSAPLYGVWFGQRNSAEPGIYWWRKHLHAAIESAAKVDAVQVRNDAIDECAKHCDLEAEAYSMMHEGISESTARRIAGEIRALKSAPVAAMPPEGE